MRIILISMFICLQVRPELISTAACSFSARAGMPNHIQLTNNEVMGWVQVYNKTAQWLKLVNPQKPNYFYYLKPYGSKSFNWRGTKQIVCYQAKIGNAGTYKPVKVVTAYDNPEGLEYVAVNCSDVLNIVECQGNTTRLRWNELGLIDYYINPPRDLSEYSKKVSS